jgi:hypothetical protein
VPARCTRYRAVYGCRLATRANGPVYFWLRPLYAATVRGLSAGGRELYAAANICFYLGLMPVLLLGLTCSALRNASTIRQLKRQP